MTLHSLANSQTEEQPSCERGSGLEICSQEIEEPTPQGRDRRGASNAIFRPVEQVLKTACGARPVDPDDRNRPKILKENESSTKDKGDKLCTFLNEYARAYTTYATES